MKTSRFFLSAVLLLPLASRPLLLDGQTKDQKAARRQESDERYKKWLKEDVIYIITDEEKAVFQKLTTDEERDAFVEQFWQRRNPDPKSSTNEFKEEHYRRIAYANEHFTSGDPGWMTDRGRIYIIHGKPDSVESRPDGGAYVRPIEEGGGNTSVYPYEKWRYRHIEGLGSNIELEFVDKTNTGKYELATSPYDKDSLLAIGLGPTLAEQSHLATRADHPALTPAAGGAQYGGASYFTRRTDTPFARYELAAKVQAPPVIKYPELKELVSVNVKYKMLPFEFRRDYLRLNDDQILVPITVQVRNSDLAFKSESGSEVARVGVYGVVTSLTGRIIHEFEDDFVVSLRKEDLEKALQKFAAYQKVISLNQGARYKLDLVLKDLGSGNIGVIQQALIPPPYDRRTLSTSTLILSNFIQPLKTIPTGDEMFVLGDVKVLPKLDKHFTLQMPLGVYLQVYNAALDPTTDAPSLTVQYKLYKDGKMLAVATDENGESTQFFSGRRVVLVKELKLDGLSTGDYQILVEVVDRLSSEKVQVTGDFSVTETRQAGQGSR
jgi:GWxTD domain-containing protein